MNFSILIKGRELGIDSKEQGMKSVTWHQSRGATARGLACSQCFLSLADSLQLNSSSLPPLQYHLIVTKSKE
jgi:hypothetical protein